MKKVNVLLFDSDPQNGSGEKLYQLIETNSGDSVNLRHEIITKAEMSSAVRKLSSILTKDGPDLAFFIFGPNFQPIVEDLFKVFHQVTATLPVIAVINTGEPKQVTEALYHGANDFLVPPFREINVLPRLWRWVETTQTEDAAIHSLKKQLGLDHIVGESAALLSEIKKIPLIARCLANVLIAGETGTGKEVFARAIHYLSPRVSKPFIAVNCGAIPPELIENELFGHAPGAFTGATTTSVGLILEADGGALFLDEIDSLPTMAQVKLLRFLQEKEFRPLGSRKTCKVDVQVIAACNVNLEEAVAAGRFRQDLYYRLKVVTLNLPPLRERRGDIPLLSRYFVAKFTTELGRPGKRLTPAAMQKLALYEWPGNVRELENAIESSIILSENVSIAGDEIILPQSAAATGEDSLQVLKAIAITDFERKYIRELLLATEGNIAEAARRAKKNRRAFFELMRKHHLEPGRRPPAK